MQSALWKWFPGFLENLVAGFLSCMPLSCPAVLGALRLEHPLFWALTPPMLWPPGTAFCFTFREKVWVPYRQGLAPTDGHKGTRSDFSSLSRTHKTN